MYGIYTYIGKVIMKRTLALLLRQSDQSKIEQAFNCCILQTQPSFTFDIFSNNVFRGKMAFSYQTFRISFISLSTFTKNSFSRLILSM